MGGNCSSCLPGRGRGKVAGLDKQIYLLMVGLDTCTVLYCTVLYCTVPSVELRHDWLGGCQLGDQVAVEQQLLAVAATPELVPKY